MITTETFDREFELHRDQLKSYILRICTSVSDTDDIVQDTWIKARKNLDKFREESSIKTWIFSIASNLAKDLLKNQQRWPENVTDICKEAALNNQNFFQEAMSIRHQSPQGNFEIKEHIAFCFTCISKSLNLEQHLVLLLKDIYQFKLQEIAEILDLNLPQVKYHLHESRTKMNEIFDGRCALINKNGTCHQCSELNGIFNPKQNTQEELMKLKLVKDSMKSDKEHLWKLRMEILQDLDPFKSGAAELQLHHLEHNGKVINEYLKKRK